MLDRDFAEARVECLHAAERQERALAKALPPGDAQDEHWMRGDRLSDEAWSIEERYDLEPAPSGLWR